VIDLVKISTKKNLTDMMMKTIPELHQDSPKIK